MKLFQQRETRVFQFLEKCPPSESETLFMYSEDPEVDTKTCIFIQVLDMAKKSLLRFRRELLESLAIDGYGTSTLSSMNKSDPVIKKEKKLIKQLDNISTFSVSAEAWDIRKKEINSDGINIYEIAERYDEYVRLRNHICHSFKPQDDSQRSGIPRVQQIREDLLNMLQYVIKPFIECHFPEIL